MGFECREQIDSRAMGGATPLEAAHSRAVGCSALDYARTVAAGIRRPAAAWSRGWSSGSRTDKSSPARRPVVRDQTHNRRMHCAATPGCAPAPRRSIARLAAAI